jgi:mannose-6-phosphate isomerase
MMNIPLRCRPFLRPMVWGGRRLGDVLGKVLPWEEAYGESWEVSDHPLHRSFIENGPLAGRSLRQLMEQERGPLLGPAAERYATFPWLVKFLDARDWLSVQVHPDDASVRRLWPGEGGKTEAWFVLDAAPGSRIFAGLLPGTTEARLREALQAGKVADCLHQFTPRPGDCIFLAAGTVHAVGGGVLMAEVQQTSDATFRLFDWNRRDAQGRSRELHIEQSLACVHWDRGPVTPVHVEHFAPQGSATNDTVRCRQALVECPYFRLSYVQDTDAFVVGGLGRLQVILVLRGRGRIATTGAEEELHVGQTWILPASMPGARCRPQPGLGVLVATLP